MRSIVTAIVVIIASAYAGYAQPVGTGQKTFRDRFESLVQSRGSVADSARLHQLFDLAYEYNMNTYPEWATWEGYPGQNGRWTDNSIEAIERRHRDLQWQMDVLKSVDRSSLSESERVNYDLYRKGIEDDIAGHRFPGHLQQINQLGGPQQSIPQMLSMMPHTTAAEYRDILSRMRGVPTVLQQSITLMDEGAKRGVTPPKVTLRDVPQQVLNVLKDDPMQSPLLEAFTEIPESIPAAEREELKKEAIEIYRQQLAPAFKQLHEFLVTRYLPAARESIAASSLPDGPEWYAFRVRRTTTTNMSPKEIHELGLREVKRIRAEMEQVMRSTGFKGSFAEFTNFLRTDKQFFFDKPEELLAAYRDIAKRADPELIKLFGKLPRLPYGVIPVPSYAEKSQTTAYYNSGSLKAGRPGYFYANLYDLSSRPKWEMEALTLHEAVPGHHLQISIAQEMEDMPQFRKDGDYTAFVEGWGLYSESLGEEMGFYKDPYSKFGQLTYEMWRAIRLVVDTGIHTMGWTREQAIAYFKENSSKSEHDITVEVDRYIVWPGQALAYKIGELKIKELRKYATEQLGDKFDIRAFHDHLLGNGALPLDVLESNIKQWVAEVKMKNKS
jgi:uncharacterized protein (DUF885 family)